MKILVLGINYAPELTGVGKYTAEMCEWLVSKGEDVRVVTAPPYYPDWAIQTGFSGHLYTTAHLAGVQVHRCPLWVPKKVTGVTRLLHLTSFAVSCLLPLLWQALKWRPDVVVVIEPTFLCSLGGLLAARLASAKAWLHIQDFEIDAALSLGMVNAGPLSRLVFAVESKIMKLFAAVSTISVNMVSRLKQKGVPPERLFFLPNWVDLSSMFPDADAGERIRSELGISRDKTVLLYSGNMGEKQGLDIIIKVAERFKDDSRLEFVMCGEGVAKAKLIDMARANENVRFIPLQPLEKLNALLNMADIHLLPQRADAEDLVMPSKLTGILASNQFVIAGAREGTALATTVRDAGGVVYEPESEDSLEAQITQAIQTLGERSNNLVARRYAEAHLNINSILGEFRSNLQSLGDTRTAPIC